MKATRSDSDTLADRLRKCYQYERNEMARCFKRPDGYRVPRLWRACGREKAGKTAFHKLALFCQKRGIDPVHYVQWVFADPDLFEGPTPEPNQLLAPQKMDAYRDSRHKLREARKNSFKRELDAARREWYYQRAGSSPAKAWAIVLMNPHLEVSPLFRYCIALDLGMEMFDRIAAGWEAGAMLQYQRDPEAYDAPWFTRVLPPGFAARVARFYEQILDEGP